MGEVCSIEDSWGSASLFSRLDDVHYVYVDSELRPVLCGRLRCLALLARDHEPWFTLSSIASNRRKPNSCAMWANEEEDGRECEE